MPIPLELLAPAGSAEIGIAALDHGADAVYIGAPQFSARANAGVRIADIARLVQQAHLYYAKVYVALNTILMDQELPEALDCIREIYDLGADGLIIQDTGLLEMDLPAIPLIASTQMHNDTPEKIRFLEDVGFKRVILARELSLEEIAAIRKNSRIELEFFVHGALCVSYSGQCYMSQAAGGRSGNRGVCAQPCRSQYTLEDGDGNIVLSDKHLLSLKDLNLMKDIPSLAAAGVTSFKIEGRYKEADYVKNVTAAYSRTLDEFIQTHPEYRRRSSGRAEPTFNPDPAKSFNRGFSRYCISGQREKIASMDTPKSIGEPIGKIVGLGKGFLKTECPDLQNGDGLCFFPKEGNLSGLRVERVENARIFPNSMKGLTEGVVLYRNHNVALLRALKGLSSRRRIDASMHFNQDKDSVRLAAIDEDGNKAEAFAAAAYEEPRDSEKAREQIKKQVSSSGATPFKVTDIQIAGRIGFLTTSFLNGMKRDVLSELAKIRLENYYRESKTFTPNNIPYPDKKLDYHANVFNEKARSFYMRHGAEIVEPAFESLSDPSGKEVMRTRYCLRYELDACLKSVHCNLKEPLYISDDRRQYLLKFDCKACHMSVIFVGQKPHS